MDLASVADELYGLLPAEFTAARNARAKAAGAEDKALADQIRRLPKPSAAAWAVNMIVRRRPDEFTGIVELGVSLREAQDALDPGEMKALGQQRQALIAAVAPLARDLAAELGNPISAPAVVELEQTLQAAMADAGAALAVRTGRLVRALASTGLEPPDLSGAVAGPPPEPEAPGAQAAIKRRPSVTADQARRSERDQARARQAVADAERRDEKARAAVEAIDARLTELAALREHLTNQLDELEARVAEVTRDAASADHETRSLRQDRDRASRTAAEAQRHLARARDTLSPDE